MRLTEILLACFLSFVLAGCGGTSGNNTIDDAGGDGDGGGDSSLDINLALVDSVTGDPATSVSAASPGELRAIVTFNGATVPQEVVNFTTTAGALRQSSALTNASGLATVVVEVGTATGGAGTVTAEVTVGEETVTENINFSISGTGTSATVDMGNGTGSAFVAGVVDLGGITSLSAGGTLTATVSIVETSNSNVTYTTPVTVNFTSTCVTAGTASMDATDITTNGIASSTYLAQGCTGSDTITATADVGGTIGASASFTVQSAGVGSIEFVSASPESISLQGTGGSGGTETSVVTFRVVDAQGNPVANQTVNFVLGTDVGGLSLSPVSAVSDQDGLVQTVVQSGTVSTSVSVTATTVSAGVTYQTQSSQLVVTTGIPDQDSFSLSATILAPEAWNVDGVISVITARLADRFNNPVPDGTAVTFTTEGGSIDGSCVTANGTCSVTWTSQSPRPCGQVMYAADVEFDASVDPDPESCFLTGGADNPVDPVIGFAPLGQPYGGRATIVATVVGEESFADTNGDGVFNDGETMTDLPEAWVDADEDGVQGPYERIFDFNSNGNYDTADGEFNGVLCDRTVAPLCSLNEALHVRESLVLVMAGNGAYIDVVDSALLPAIVPFNNANKIDLSCDGTVGFTVIYSDLHHQPMPTGTKVTVTSTHGQVVFGGSFTQANINYNGAIHINGMIEGAGNPATPSFKNGALIVKVETPGKVVSQEVFPVTETCP